MEAQRIEITVCGKQYPCMPTMGAFLRFKQETGHDITEMQGDLSDLTTYLYCCASSACKREGVEFGYTLMQFADSVMPEDLVQWAAALGADVKQKEQEEGKKKQ